MGLLVKDNNGSDSIVVNNWQIQQFWKSYHDVYIPHRSDVSVSKHGQGDDEACRCLRLNAWGRLKRFVITDVCGAANVMCQTVYTIICSVIIHQSLEADEPPSGKFRSKRHTKEQKPGVPSKLSF